MRAPRNPQTGPPDEPRWWLGFSLAVAVLFLSWGPLFEAALGSRVFWEALESRLGTRQDQALQAAFFELDPERRYPAVVFGDAGFVAAVRNGLGEEGSAGFVVRTDRLDSVADFVDALAGVSFERAFIQNRPYFWSNLEPSSPAQDLVQWRAHALGEAARPGAFWRVVGAWAEGAGTPETRRRQVALRGGSLVGVRFALPPPQHRRGWNRLRRAPESVRGRLVWVADLTGLPVDTPPALAADFRVAVSESEALAQLGRHVWLADVVRGGEW